MDEIVARDVAEADAFFASLTPEETEQFYKRKAEWQERSRKAV